MKIRKALFILLFAMFLVLICLVVNQSFDTESQSVFAQEFQTTPTPDSESPHEDTSQCLGCHSDPSMVGRFQDGTTVSLYVDPDAHEGATRHLMRCPIFVSQALNPYTYHPMTQGKIERYHRSMKNIVKLQNYYSPWELQRELASFVEFYNYQHYHEALDNMTPADVFFGRQKEVLDKREEIKRRTLQQRRLHNLQTSVSV